MTWSEIDIVENIDYAVDLGVLTVPAVAIDGDLVFARLPTAQQLLSELTARSQRS
jgi:predicted thioredoxin/glutaredoxin